MNAIKSVKGGPHDIWLSWRGADAIHFHQIHFYLTLYGVASFILVIYCVSKEFPHVSLYLTLPDWPSGILGFQKSDTKNTIKWYLLLSLEPVSLGRP